MESKEKLSNEEFEFILNLFIQRRLKDGKTREQTKEEFGDSYSLLSIKQFEMLMFHDFLIEFDPEMLLSAINDNNEESKSYIKFMLIAWLFRADFHHRSINKSDLEKINKTLH